MKFRPVCTAQSNSHGIFTVTTIMSWFRLGHNPSRQQIKILAVNFAIECQKVPSKRVSKMISKRQSKSAQKTRRIEKNATAKCLNTSAGPAVNRRGDGGHVLRDATQALRMTDAQMAVRFKS